MNISVIGLGKLGLCTAACTAVSGHKVYCFDVNDSIMQSLKNRVNPIDETGLSDLLERCWDNLNFVSSVSDAVTNSSITMIVVPTPSGIDGKFVNTYVSNAISSIGVALANKRDFHVINVVSTVMPGSSDKEFIPALETLSNKKCGVDFGFVYNPEFIALGSVIQNFQNPDMLLIGSSDDKSSQIMRDMYAPVCLSKPLIALMSPLNAEITKLTLNCFVTMKISFVNELASICENITGANANVITDAIGKDSRIGHKYTRPGLGFGGPCFPRDNIAFQMFAKDAGVEVHIGPAVVRANNAVVERVVKQVSRLIAAGSRIAIYGLSYKPNTHIIEESQALMISKKLAESYVVSVFDPKAMNAASEVLQDSVIYSDNPIDNANNADIVLVLTDWHEFRSYDWKKIQSVANEGCIFIDYWKYIDSWSKQ